MMRKITLGITVFALLLGARAANAQDPEAGAATMTDWTDTQSSAGNTIQNARMLYTQGVRQLHRADKLVDRAQAETDEAKRAELLERSTEANEEAVSTLLQALKTNAGLIEAYASLGEGYRRLGKYQEALEVHAIALRRDADSMENFEGWADALLHLNMLGNAVASYDKYVEEGSPRAPVLMDAIKEWLAEKQQDPGELDPAHVEKMAAWVAEHDKS